MHELLESGLVSFGRGADPGSPEYAEHGTAFEQHEIERQSRNVAGGEADHEMTPLPSERAHCRLAVGAADRIEHDVDAMLTAQASERLAQILSLVVHHVVRAMGAGEIELVVGGSAGDHSCAHQRPDFDCGQSHTSGRAEHGQRLASA